MGGGREGAGEGREYITEEGRVINETTLVMLY